MLLLVSRHVEGEVGDRSDMAVYLLRIPHQTYSLAVGRLPLCAPVQLAEVLQVDVDPVVLLDAALHALTDPPQLAHVLIILLNLPPPPSQSSQPCSPLTEL